MRQKLALNVLSIYKNIRSFLTILILYVVDINAFVWYKLGYNNVVVKILFIYMYFGKLPHLRMGISII